ncbi:MAG: hypothetical protein R2790_02680 [Flavobacterium haoranii]
MKKLIILIILGISTICFGQKSVEFADSIRTTFNIPEISYAVISGDSILEIATVGKHSLNLPDLASLEDRFHIGSNTKAMTAFIIAKYVEKGNKTNIPAKLIKKLTFTDFANRVRTFKYDGKKQLLEIIYDGKHKAFVTYAANPYDGSIVSYIDFYNTEGKRIKVGAFKTSKSALKKVVQTRPDLVKFIDESNLTHYEVIRHVLSELDKDF